MKIILQSFRILIFFTLLTGIIYPLTMTGLSQIIFPKLAGGSLVEKNGIVIGSSLIAQKFTKPEYFWPRPSAADFNANPSGASNLGPISQDLKKQIDDRREQFAKAFGVNQSNIPQDLLTSSASGLDPHISLEAAKIQVQHVATARKLSGKDVEKINQLVDSLTEKPDISIFGEWRVNVLKLNLALDEMR